MSIAFVNSGVGSVSGSTSRLSFTCGAGSDLLVAVLCVDRAITVSSVNYGGTPMTLLQSQSNGRGTHIAYLYNPTTGVAQNIDWNHGGAPGRMFASTYQNSDSAFTPISAGVTGTSVTASQSITPTAANGVIVSGCAHERNDALTGLGAGQVSLWGGGAGVDEGLWTSGASYELNATTAADTQEFTATGSDKWAIVSAFFAPAVGDATPPTSSITTTATKISRVPGYDSTDITVTANEPVVEYEVRLVPASGAARTEGTSLETGTIAATTSFVINVTDDELVAANGGAATDGVYTLGVWVKDEAGNWSTAT